MKICLITFILFSFVVFFTDGACTPIEMAETVVAQATCNALSDTTAKCCYVTGKKTSKNWYACKSIVDNIDTIKKEVETVTGLGYTDVSILCSSSTLVSSIIFGLSFILL